jgi:vacuolar-type H+-ATPase subunit H
MYHPAAGLHQASLADVIRADFKKLPIYLEQASRLLPPAPAEAQEHVHEADEMREEVIHRAETAAVLPGDEILQEIPDSTPGSASNVIDEGAARLPADSSANVVAGEIAAQTTVTADANELPQDEPAPNGKRARRGRRGRQAPQQSSADDAGEGKDDSEEKRENGNEGKDYRQLSFF